MSKDPAFLFYSQDFIVGVQTMSFEDRGKYITLLAQMHQQGRMNEETIRFLVGNVSVSLKSKFLIDENGFWYNNRLEEEQLKREKFIDSRRKNGKMGGRPKASAKPNGKPLAKPNAKPKSKPTHNLSENENENENNIKNSVPSFNEFLSYAKDQGLWDDSMEFQLMAKYDSWVENNWKDGNNKKIKNWKTKLRNCLPYFKKQFSNGTNKSNIVW